MPAATLEFRLESIEAGPNGADRVSLQFASDDRLESGAIQDVASGGELSRLILALRLATRAEGAGTLVFDEVDAGVGGATALALGRKLADLGQVNQVLCVTHLPQVAAHAACHYVVKRDGDRAAVVRVEGEDRLEELSRMLAGLPESVRGKDAAAELLELTLNG
jgi:DNA repair protein RecN (Recombination protein N)